MSLWVVCAIPRMCPAEKRDKIRCVCSFISASLPYSLRVGTASWRRPSGLWSTAPICSTGIMCVFTCQCTTLSTACMSSGCAIPWGLLQEGYTALHYAAANSHIAVMEWLVHAGISPHKRSRITVCVCMLLNAPTVPCAPDRLCETRHVSVIVM